MAEKRISAQTGVGSVAGVQPMQTQGYLGEVPKNATENMVGNENYSQSQTGVGSVASMNNLPATSMESQEKAKIGAKIGAVQGRKITNQLQGAINNANTQQTPYAEGKMVTARRNGLVQARNISNMIAEATGNNAITSTQPSLTPSINSTTEGGISTTEVPSVSKQGNVQEEEGQVEQQKGSPFRNANVNLNQYGDDSSPDNQSILGGRNEKYTGEGVKTSNLEYDPNITTKDLDPNYLYGMEAQYQNSKDPGYIARRNDMIASALYNEGKTSKEDVAQFLASQKGWNNSTPEDRANTIESIWKRLGAMQQEQPQQEQPQQEQQTGENRPGMDLGAREGGTIYGRASGDENSRIDTLSDPNSPEARYLEGRQNNYKALQGMDSYDIAVSVANGFDPYGSQAMRDLSQYDPAKYKEIQDYIKQINGEEDINNIATNGSLNKTSQTEKATDTINNSIQTWVNKNSTERTASQAQSLLTNKLANSQVANSATQEMLNLNSQMADIQERLNNLPNEAKKVFKGDTSQYILDAYVSNNAQKLQSELSKLQSRYNGAIDLYKTELSQKQREAEMELKEREYNFRVSQQQWENTFAQNQQARTQYYQGRQLQLSSIKTDSNGKPYVINYDGTYTYLTDDTYNKAVKAQVEAGVSALNTVWQDGMTGGQCEAFTDSFNRSVYGMEMLPRDAQGNVIQGRSYTTAAEKASYANSAVPIVGSTAIFNYGPNANVSAEAKKYGHTMIVTGYDQDTGMISLKGSNNGGDEKVYSTTMSVQDFYSKRGGVGFRDPAQDMKLQANSGAVAQQSGNAMTSVFDKLITNANTEGKLNTVATAEAMYNSLAEIRDNGSLNSLITSGDLKKVLASIDQKKFREDDGGSVLASQIQKAITKKSLNPQSQIALNKLYMLVEMKLRKESGAAISSSERYSNFQMMLPQAYETTEVQLSKLKNWDDVIKRYARVGGMKYDEYIPLFSDSISTRETR